MDVPEKGNENTVWLVPPAQAVAPARDIPFYKLDTEGLKKFFDLTGGSILYCLSAVFVAYGIVNVMGPMLSMGEALKNALPCIFTLHAYELALLGVLILIVSRKVVDDAISVVVLIGLFLVGTSIALGSVADTGIRASVWLGLFSVAIVFVKFYAMRRFVRIPLRLLAVLGLLVLMACNYFGPTFLAWSVVVKLLPESSRRELWWLIWLVMLIGAGLVIIEAMRQKPPQRMQKAGRTPFLQTPVMVYMFTFIVVAASGTHQYAMAYTNGLQRVIADYTLIIAAGVLLILEMLRLSGKQFGFAEVVVSCVPLAITMFAIEEKSVVSSFEFGLGLLGYPPAILTLSGLAIVCWSLYHRRYAMLAVGVLYGLGVILTFAFSPEHPYDLNTRTCVGAIVIVLLLFGLLLRNQYLCVAALVVLCVGLSYLGAFRDFTRSYELATAGGLAGVFGLGFVILCLVFGGKMHKAIRVVGAICIAGFMFDYLPAICHWRYAAMLGVAVLLTVILWLRIRDVLVVSILWAPFVIRIYTVTKQIAYWRSVIVGFLLLGAGAAASILKMRLKERSDSQKAQSHEGDSPAKL